MLVLQTVNWESKVMVAAALHTYSVFFVTWTLALARSLLIIQIISCWELMCVIKAGHLSVCEMFSGWFKASPRECIRLHIKIRTFDTLKINEFLHACIFLSVSLFHHTHTIFHWKSLVSPTSTWLIKLLKSKTAY